MREFCSGYPQLTYEDTLIEAVRIAVDVEKRFDPKRGHNFSTPLRKHLMGLIRFVEKISGDNETDIYLTKEEKARLATEEAHQVPAPSFRGGNGARLTVDFQWLEPSELKPTRHRRVVMGAA